MRINNIKQLCQYQKYTAVTDIDSNTTTWIFMDSQQFPATVKYCPLQELLNYNHKNDKLYTGGATIKHIKFT